jgi:hypothetical protein
MHGLGKCLRGVWEELPCDRVPCIVMSRRDEGAEVFAFGYITVTWDAEQMRRWFSVRSLRL